MSKTVVFGKPRLLLWGRQPTTGIGPMGEVVTCLHCRHYLRHDHDLHRLETSAAPARIGSFASVTAGPSCSWLFTIASGHSLLRDQRQRLAVATCRSSEAHGRSSPHARATYSWRTPLSRPSISTAVWHEDVREQCLRHPDRPAGSPDRPGAGRARSDDGAGRRRLVAVRPAHSDWAGAGWCLGPLPAVFLQMSRPPACSKTSRQPARWRRRALPQTSPRPG